MDEDIASRWFYDMVDDNNDDGDSESESNSAS